MFFYISKIVWFFIQPSVLLALIFLAGLFLAWRKRQSGLRILTLAIAIYVIGGFSPLANALMASLEHRYEKPDPEKAGAFTGVIVLGGIIDGIVSREGGQISMNERAERLTEAAVLARLRPDARVVFTGGDGALLYRGLGEAQLAKRFFIRLGLDPERITIETKSRNTWENASFTKELIQPKAGERWLLITSAFHMHRALGVFRAAGITVTPWPVDFRTRREGDMTRFSPRPSFGWKRIDLIAKEWVGYFAYWLTGRLA